MPCLYQNYDIFPKGPLEQDKIPYRKQRNVKYYPALSLGTLSEVTWLSGLMFFETFSPF